jgi:hypothetical protein
MFTTLSILVALYLGRRRMKAAKAKAELAASDAV